MTGLLAVFGLLIFGGRNAIATGVVEQSAADAARAATLARSPAAAQAAANDIAAQSLSNQGLSCVSTSVQTNTAAFGTAPGQLGAQVSVTISCTINLSDLGLPGLPGSKTITATALSPLDTYRER